MGSTPSSAASWIGKRTSGRPRMLCRTLGSRLFIRVPLPAARITEAVDGMTGYYKPRRRGQFPEKAPGDPMAVSVQGPRNLVDLRQLGDFALAGGVEVAKAASLRENPALQGAHRAVVGLDRAAEVFAQVDQVLEPARQAIMQLAPQLGDALGILGDALLTPADGDGPQKRDEGHGSGEHDLGLAGILDQTGIAFGGRSQKAVVGDEHHDELGGVDLGPIALLGEPLDVAAHQLG